MVRIAGLPVWGPSDMVAGARALVGWTDDAVGVVSRLPERTSALLDDVELLVARVGEVADRADTVLAAAESMVARMDPLLADVRATADDAAALITRAGAVADGAAGVIDTAGGVADSAGAVIGKATSVADSAGVVIAKATSVADSAGAVVDEAAGASRTATELLALYEPLSRRAAPLAQRFVDELSEAEVDAAIRLIDQVPQFTEHMEADIMPILATLDRVGPDVHELLDVLKDVRLAIQGLPGFTLLRRRGERQESQESD